MTDPQTPKPQQYIPWGELAQRVSSQLDKIVTSDDLRAAVRQHINDPNTNPNGAMTIESIATPDNIKGLAKIYEAQPNWFELAKCASKRIRGMTSDHLRAAVEEHISDPNTNPDGTMTLKSIATPDNIEGLVEIYQAYQKRHKVKLMGWSFGKP